MVIMLMAALFFYGGAGINLISYCCNLCRNAGIEAVLNDKCCDIHRHNHATHQIPHLVSGCCFSECEAHDIDVTAGVTPDRFPFYIDHAPDNCCKMKRISFDLFSTNSSEHEISLTSVFSDFISFNLLDVTYLDISPVAIHTPEPHGPPIALPRDYLSILTVLLI